MAISQAWHQCFGATKTLIGMIHLPALPGTPFSTLTPDEVIERAVGEARLLAAAGFPALMIENMHDRPYLKNHVGSEITATVAVIARAIKQAVDLPLGIQILAGANKSALAAAHSGGADFIRAEGFVFGHVADEGWIESGAGDLLRYRKQIGAERVMVLCDVKKKHAAHAMTADVSLTDTVTAAEFFATDGVIVTGAHTGVPADAVDLRAAYSVATGPVLVGSGVSAATMADVLPHVDGVIIGSELKTEGDWRNPLDEARCKAVVAAFQTETFSRDSK